MPQPLSSVRPVTTLRFGGAANPALNNPEMALLGISIIAQWSMLEVALSWLFVELLGTNAAPAAAVFASIRSQSGQRDAIAAVLPTAFGDDRDKQDLVLAALDVFSRASKVRNRVAHWVWGYSPEIPKAVLLGDPQAFAAVSVESKEFLETQHAGGIPALPHVDHNRIFIYEAQDFEDAIATIQRAKGLIIRLQAALSLGLHNADEADRELLQLSGEPEIRRVLDRLNKDRRTDP